MGALRAAILLAAAITAGSCAWLDPRWWECREISSASALLGVSFTPEVRQEGGLTIGLYEGGGISLYLYGFPSLYRCARLSPEELDRWTEAIEALASHLHTPTRRLIRGELVTVHRTRGPTEVLAPVDRLGPEALEATRAVACLAYEQFGKPARNALREAAPGLAVRLQIPRTCTPFGRRQPANR